MDPRTIDVLVRARKSITDKDRWTYGTEYRNKAMCARGAVLQATSEIVRGEPLYPLCEHPIAGEHYEEIRRLAIDALEALNLGANLTTGHSGIVPLNDGEDGHERVLDVFDRVIYSMHPSRADTSDAVFRALLVLGPPPEALEVLDDLDEELEEEVGADSLVAAGT